MKKYVYTDDSGTKHCLPEEAIQRAIEYKLELQKANGRASWNKICSWLKKDGYDAKKSEGLRTLVKRVQRQQHKLPNSNQYINANASHKLNQIEKEMGELALLKRDTQNQLREFNKIRRQVLDNQLWHNELKNTVVDNLNFNVKPFKDTKKKCQSNKPSGSLIVCMSDWHIGAKFSGNGYEYNLATFWKTLEEYTNKVLQQIDNKNPKNIYIIGLGDIIENAYMRFNQGFEIEINYSEQQKVAIEAVLKFIDSILLHTNGDVYYTAIVGNHDRSHGNKKENAFGDGFIVVLNQVVKMFGERYKNFNYIEPDSSIRSHLIINGVNVAIEHGDLLQLSDKNLLAKVSQRDNRLYQLLLVGHLHHYYVSENNGLVVMSGSFKGQDNYSTQLNLRAKRSQALVFIDKLKHIEPIPIWL